MGGGGGVLKRKPFYLLVALPALYLAAACGGSSPAASSSATLESINTAAAPPAATATVAPAAAPDGERILSYVKRLADEIGPRSAGTQKEQAAVDFIAGALKSFGYDVSIQNFPIANEASRDATLSVSSPSPRTIAALPFGLSGAARFRGTVIAAGVGHAADFPSSVSGSIALIERGQILFQEKVNNAVAAGARGVIIFNNEPGTFLGTLSQSVQVPVVSISQNEGQALLRDLGGGSVEADIAVGTLGGSVAYNVIARPPGKECETVTGGHFDSVPQAPGASDNGSGTAVVLEIAAILARNGQTGSNCFVLFGAEELGLVGSRYFVSSLSPEQRARIKAVLNLDMVGVGEDSWLLIGSPNLQSQAQALADQMGIQARRGQLNGTSSDHASFIGAGIPALMLHRWEDPLLHTPQDVSPRVRPNLLEQAARLGIAFLLSLSQGG